MSASRHPWTTLVLVAIAVGLCASQLPTMQFASSPDLYLDEDDIARVEYNAMRTQFGRDDMAFIAITPAAGGKVFELGFLERLRALHLRLENELPWIEEVQSLVTARLTRGEGDSLVVGELMEDWPADAAAVAALERKALATPFYRNLYLSEDGRTTGLVIRPLTHPVGDEVHVLEGFESDVETEPAGGGPDAEVEFIRYEKMDEMALVLRGILETSDLGGAEIHAVGLPVLNLEVQAAVGADMARFSGLSMLVIALLLGVVFRRVVAVILPLAIVACSVLVALGLMAFLGRPMTMVSQIVPSFILAVGVGFAVHLLSIYFQLIDRGTAPRDALPRALRHSGPAILMSALTTAFGMFSFIPSGLLPVRDVGIFVPLGVLTAALLALIVIPAVLALFPVRPRKPDADSANAVLPTERLLIACARFGTRHPLPLVLLTLVALGAAAIAIPRIPPSYNMIEWLADDSPYVLATDSINVSLGGGGNMEIVVDAGRENGLSDPANLRRIEAIQQHLETHPAEEFAFQKTTSISDVVKEIHQALHEGRSDSYAIADDPRLIAQELLLFENSGSDDLEQVVDSQFRLARISLKGEQADGGAYLDYLDLHSSKLRELAGDMTLTITGLFSLAAHVIELTINTAVESYLMAFLLITPIMILFVGDFRTGIVSMAPNLIPIAIVLGIMGWSGTALDVFTVLIAGIALGLVVDDTLHILHGFRVNYAESKDLDTAIARTMQTTGRAVLFTTVVLTSAFSIYGLATAESVVAFGLFTALAVFLAFFFDLFLTPALLALVYRGRGGS